MPISSVGDLMTSHLLRAHHANLKGDLSRLVAELSSGRVASVEKAVNGDFRGISGLRQSLTGYSAFKTATSEAAGFAAAQQASLESVRKEAEALS